MSDNTQHLGNPEPGQEPDLLTNFQKILALFDRENQIYKTQINILKDAVNTLQNTDATNVSNIRRELNELRVTLGSLEPQLNSVAPNISNSGANLETPHQYQQPLQNTRQITDYLCQICLDSPRDCILEPCMHFCLCNGCVIKLPESKCPICRRKIEFFQNVFIS